MALSASKPPDSKQTKPGQPRDTKAPEAPRVISKQVFNDFASI